MDQVFTVSQLNNRIRELFELDPVLAGVSVRGELSNYKVYPSGHHYFTLKDQESSIRCVMFKSAASRLRFKPESGMGVTAFGRVSVYPRDGAYQLYCEKLSPEGLGDLHLAFEQLKAKLEKEGLFAPEHKKTLPRMPGIIAVITSSAGAAVRDIIRVLGRRWPMTKVVVLPVRVQGEEAPAEIAGALAYANRHRVADLIITGRGGGSIEDLWAFNDERVARAIFDSEIPVISAVGHEPDVTISDFVADLRAATPSNAAELAVPDAGEVIEYLRSAELRSVQAMKKKLETLSASLNDLSSRRVMQSPGAYVDLKRMELDFLRSRLASAGERTVAGQRSKFAALCASMDALSPLKVLGRGYAIARTGEGQILKDASAVGEGQRILVSLQTGELGCTVTDKYESRGV